MMNVKGEQIGTAVISARPQGIDIAFDIKDLPPGEHGFHVHENPKCEGPDFESAGAHFNPDNRAHGIQNPDGPHAGDLRNVFVRAAGTSDTTVSANKLTLDSSPTSVLRGSGTSLVIHANPDDGRTDPSGNSGARIACGVIAR